MKHIIYLIALLFSSTLFAQQGSKYHSAYDDSTLQMQGPITLMPFNRLVLSAGKVVTFGDPRLENHALDFALLPGEKYMAVEDRYGIAVLEISTQQIKHRWTFEGNKQYSGYMSTYSGIKAFAYNGHVYITWGAGGGDHKSAVMIADWSENGIANVTAVQIPPVPPADAALPNETAVQFEDGKPFLYTVLNGNNQLIKIDFTTGKIVWAAPTGVAPYGLKIVGNKAYITNWAGPLVTDTTLEHAGTPWGSAYTNPVTGGTARGSLTVINIQTGLPENELPLGLHPNAIISSPDEKFLYIANGNSDYINVVDIAAQKVTDSINVGMFTNTIKYYGSSPNALAVDAAGTNLYVTNGFDNAVCIVALGSNASAKGTGASQVKGYIPTEAYPGGITLLNNNLYVANIEAKGSRVLTPAKGVKADGVNGAGTLINAYAIHQELASLSIIPVPSNKELKVFTNKVREQSLAFRIALTNRAPRTNVAPRPLPDRIGEPSVFKHVVYIIKENKTYDQVYGDVPAGRGEPGLCIYGDSVTPNQHKLVNTFSLMDNYYASGKSSAEGHQWANAAMVSDYIEKSVRAWFRSYPHRQEDALVYNKNGFIWNNALDHGKKVRIFGEACLTHYNESLKWLDIYNAYLQHKDQGFYNTSTIARIRPVISPAYPDNDNLVFTDQLRAEIFINEWKQYEAGDSLPDLMVVSLPNDHTAGTSPDFPVPKAMVADNDLALGRIIDVITHSRYWDSTVVFVTEDDSQSGWDHISSYRTTGLVMSAYPAQQKVVHTNYNQTSMVRTIEQILGLPPMNIIDAAALPMFDCFGNTKNLVTYTHVPNTIPLNKMNKPLAALNGKASYYAKLSANVIFKDVDGGDDDMMNKILWFDAKGNAKYPTGKK
jgi:YVTN family beta-propeller protein